jgi:hypothetical protein
MSKLSYVVRGFPGHPIHPPMAGGAIGAVAAGGTVREEVPDA